MASIPCTPGIYQWLCVPTGKVYVGSTQNLQKRRRRHLYELRRKTHSNSYLQHAWNKHGESAFLFSVLELCPVERLIEREQHWIDATRSNQRTHGFNRRIVAESDRGLKREGQALENIRQANRRQDHSYLHTPEAREKARQAAAKRRGVPFTAEHKTKLSKAKIGTKRNPEVVQRFGQVIRRQFAALTPEERARRVVPKGVERLFILTDPDGNEYRVVNLSAFCAERHLDRSSFTRIMQGKKPSYKGWTCRRLT